MKSVVFKRALNCLGSRKMICADKSFFRDFEGAALCGALFECTPNDARRIHPLRPQVCGKSSALFEKRGFQTRLNYLNNHAKKQKPRFLLFHSIWQRFALREEGEFAPLHIMCAPEKGRKERRNRCRADNMSICRRTTVSPSNLRKTAGGVPPRFS